MEGPHLKTFSLKLLRYGPIPRNREGRIAPIPIDRARPRLLNQGLDRRHRSASTQHQCATQAPDVLAKCGEAMVQPPTCGAAEPPTSGRLIVENVDGDKRRATRDRRSERRVVGKTQVVSEPDDNGLCIWRDHTLHSSESGAHLQGGIQSGAPPAMPISAVQPPDLKVQHRGKAHPERQRTQTKRRYRVDMPQPGMAKTISVHCGTMFRSPPRGLW